MSLPGEEEAKIQSDEVLFQWVAWGWSNTMRYKFRIQYEVPQVVTAPETSLVGRAVAPSELRDYLKQEHDMVKATKADDAAIPVQLWDNAVCRGPSSLDEKWGLTTMQDLLLRKYQLRLWRDARQFLSLTYGNTWSSKIHVRKSEAKEDADVIHDILWRATKNDRFEYPCGSRLIFFCFPKHYCIKAKRGVCVMYVKKGPTSKQRQPLLKPDKKEVLRNKIIKFIERKYIVPLRGRISLLIKYFAVPNRLQDRRIVFHAGANQLNDCVWAPLFCLPTINSLLRIVDEEMLMEDQDVGKMFLNFQLRPNTMRYAAVDLGPLGFTSTERSHWWMCWTRNLIGFRPSPYNSIRIYLIAEEVIQGDHNDPNNAFQWSHLLLNLPGTENYKHSLAWVSKRRKDGSLASDFVCFVDNLWITGQGRKRVMEAGHTISTRESWVGIQDALHRLRCLGGTRTPGAWAGASVCIDNDLKVVVLTSQDNGIGWRAYVSFG
jgi:hypothetical protein